MHVNSLLTLSLSAACLLALGMTVSAAEKDAAHPIYGQKMKSLSGKEVDFSAYKGKVLLIVNVASECGATPQYEPLQALHTKYSQQGLAILGFPCNQFGKQEPGTEAEIATFCKKNYGVEFDMFAKIDVNGESQAPLYKYLTSEAAYQADPGKVRWNFEKFLVSRDGQVIGRFRTAVEPDDAQVISAIEAALSAK